MISVFEMQIYALNRFKPKRDAILVTALRMHANFIFEGYNQKDMRQ